MFPEAEVKKAGSEVSVKVRAACGPIRCVAVVDRPGAAFTLSLSLCVQRSRVADEDYIQSGSPFPKKVPVSHLLVTCQSLLLSQLPLTALLIGCVVRGRPAPDPRPAAPTAHTSPLSEYLTCSSSSATTWPGHMTAA